MNNGIKCTQCINTASCAEGCLALKFFDRYNRSGDKQKGHVKQYVVNSRWCITAVWRGSRNGMQIVKIYGHGPSAMYHGLC